MGLVEKERYRLGVKAAIGTPYFIFFDLDIVFSLGYLVALVADSKLNRGASVKG